MKKYKIYFNFYKMNEKNIKYIKLLMLIIYTILLIFWWLLAKISFITLIMQYANVETLPVIPSAGALIPLYFTVLVFLYPILVWIFLFSKGLYFAVLPLLNILLVSLFMIIFLGININEYI